MSGQDSPWFMGGSAFDRPLRLYCVPFAGGSAAAFARWRTAAPAEVGVVPIQIPGRGARIRERPMARIDDLANALAEAMAPTLDRPYAVFGHSMGALLAFETARALRRRGAAMRESLHATCQ